METKKALIGFVTLLMLFTMCGCETAENTKNNDYTKSENGEIKSESASINLPSIGSVKDNELVNFVGSWEYKSGDKLWYIEIKGDGTWEQENEFAENMDIGQYTFRNGELILKGEVYNDTIKIKNGKLCTSDGVYLKATEMPVPNS